MKLNCMQFSVFWCVFVLFRSFMTDFHFKHRQKHNHLPLTYEKKMQRHVSCFSFILAVTGQGHRGDRSELEAGGVCERGGVGGGLDCDLSDKKGGGGADINNTTEEVNSHSLHPHQLTRKYMYQEGEEVKTGDEFLIFSST